MPVDKFSPVGVFDSGVGGLTVVQKMSQYLPGEKIIYFGDTANVPYGDKPAAQLIRLADSIAAFLVDQGVKAVVDACNSTSAVALDYLQERYQVPFVGVIEAGVRGALNATRNGRVGIIATKATIDSRAHEKAAKRLDPKVQILGQACSKFVPLVEAGRIDCPETAAVARTYLEPLKDAGIDTLILGCTHYPFLSSVIEEVLGGGVILVDPAVNTVMELKSLLEGQIDEADAWSLADHTYFVSGDPSAFKHVGERLLGHSLGTVIQENLELGSIKAATQGSI